LAVQVKRFSLLSLAILTSVTALVGIGPIGSAGAEEPPQGKWTANVYFRASYGVSLGKPTVVTNSGTWSLNHFLLVGDKGAGYRMKFDPPYYIRPAPDVQVKWPLLEGDARVTDFTVSAGMTFADSGPLDERCTVTDRDGQKSDRYQCSLQQRGIVRNWDLILTDNQVDRLAEASGTITTVGPVSLEGGTFETASPHHVRSAKAVPADSSTQFDATLGSSDVVTERRLASGKFRYALLDGGTPVHDRESGEPLYVSGTVYNYNGASFKGGSNCQIVAGPAYRPVANSGYSCDIDGYYGGSVLTAGRAQYITDFTIHKKR
jgi:hypothetical protein